MTDKQREAYEKAAHEIFGIFLEGDTPGWKIWKAACKWQAQQTAGAPARDLEAANMEGYDEACRVINDGLNQLMSALGIDPDSWGDDAAEAAVISGILARMARDLEPLPVQYDEDENEIRIVGQQASGAEPPEGIVTFEKGDTYRISEDNAWRAGISTTAMRESLGGSYEDLQWGNRIEVYGDSRAKANSLRDYILSSLSQPPKAVPVPDLVVPSDAPDKYDGVLSDCICWSEGWNDCLRAMLDHPGPSTTACDDQEDPDDNS